MNIFKNLSYYIIPFIVALFNTLIIIAPNIVITGARDGLLLWFNNIIPAILPFLIGTNLLIRLGFIDFLGYILEPLMKKLFNVNGSGAFALILGMLSGYPVGAKITANLRESGKLSKVEAQRLISFTNNSGPLFILGTVGIGMYQNIMIGYFILAIHYLSALTVGFLFKFYKVGDDHIKGYNTYTKISKTKYSLKTALLKLKISRIKNQSTFGQILGESVRDALEVLAMIGGFVILFSVISSLLIKVIPSISPIFNGSFMGLIEVTNGALLLSSIDGVFSVIACCGIISFAGISILAQTASMINKSDIKMSVYLVSKIMHAIISIIYAIICIPIIQSFLETPVYSTFDISIKSSALYFGCSILILIVLSLVCLYYNISDRLKNKKDKLNHHK